MHGLAPCYLNELCIPVSTVPNLTALRSAASGDLIIPRTRLQLSNWAFCVLVQSPETVYHWIIVQHLHTCSRHICSLAPTSLTVSRVWTANIVQNPCSDSSHVTTPLNRFIIIIIINSFYVLYVRIYVWIWVEIWLKTTIVLRKIYPHALICINGQLCAGLLRWTARLVLFLNDSNSMLVYRTLNNSLLTKNTIHDCMMTLLQCSAATSHVLSARGNDY